MKPEVHSHTVQRCKGIPSTGVGVGGGAIRAEITGGKDRSVTLCPPTGTFYSARIHGLSVSAIEISTLLARVYIHSSTCLCKLLNT